MWIMYEEGNNADNVISSVADNPAISATSPSVVKNNGNVGDDRNTFE